MYSVQTGTTLMFSTSSLKDHFWFVSTGQSTVEQDMWSITLVGRKDTIFQDLIALNEGDIIGCIGVIWVKDCGYIHKHSALILNYTHYPFTALMVKSYEMVS